MDDFSQQHTVVVDGVRIGYRLAGDRDRPALLMLHGLGASATTWSTLAARYESARRVVALDLRGHGASSWTGSYELPDMANDVAGVLQALELRDLTVLAHSMGASVALLLAARCQHLLERMILEEPPPPLPASPPRVEGPRPERPLDYDWNIQPQFSRQRNQPDPRWWTQLQTIQRPVTIIRGTESHIGRSDVARLAEALPNARVIEIDGGHDLHTDAPDFAPLLDDLLDDLLGPAPRP